NSHANERPFDDLLEEFDLLRKANVRLLTNLSDDGWARMGTASEKPISVRALAFIMAGHVRHHVRIFENKYLS
ncbi:MAG: DinB family protein, partial [Pyrinomonadaceae bacterium]